MTGPLTLLGRRRHAHGDDETAGEAGNGVRAGDGAESGAATGVPDETAARARRGRRDRPGGRAGGGRRGGGTGRRRPSAGTQILALLALVALVLAAAVVNLRHRGDTLRGTASGGQQAMYAAATAAQDLSSYDYRTLESDIKTAAAQTTGQLRTDYERQAQAIMATARQQQVVVNAQAVKSGVVSASHDQVVVLVFLNRTTSKLSSSASAGQERTPDQLRLLMTMKKVGGRWLVAKVELL
jgi:Mce-associated membrane protein